MTVATPAAHEPILYHVTLRRGSGLVLRYKVRGPNPDDALTRLHERGDYLPDRDVILRIASHA